MFVIVTGIFKFHIFPREVQIFLRILLCTNTVAPIMNPFLLEKFTSFSPLLFGLLVPLFPHTFAFRFGSRIISRVFEHNLLLYCLLLLQKLLLCFIGIFTTGTVDIHNYTVSDVSIAPHFNKSVFDWNRNPLSVNFTLKIQKFTGFRFYRVYCYLWHWLNDQDAIKNFFLNVYVVILVLVNFPNISHLHLKYFLFMTLLIK